MAPTPTMRSMTGQHRAVRPKPVASFVVDPPEPAAGEPVRLLDLSYDPGGSGIALHAWDLGDGETSLEAQPTHRFARDGIYTVTLHVTAPDGRVGVASEAVTVATHDVAVTQIEAPRKAHVGDDATVSVVVESRHRTEICQVELLRRRGSHGWESLAIQTRSVAAGANAEVAFAVSFVDADIGEVVFAGGVTLVGATDASPDDNALTAAPTTVAPRRMTRCVTR
jgi:hypothetical protein